MLATASMNRCGFTKNSTKRPDSLRIRTSVNRASSGSICKFAITSGTGRLHKVTNSSAALMAVDGIGVRSCIDIKRKLAACLRVGGAAPSFFGLSRRYTCWLFMHSTTLLARIVCRNVDVCSALFVLCQPGLFQYFVTSQGTHSNRLLFGHP